MVVVRYHIAKNGSTSLVHRQDYGITSVPVRYTLRPPESRRSITGRYRCSTDINEAIPEYCRCSPVARSGSASADNFKHVQKFIPSLAVADVLTMS